MELIFLHFQFEQDYFISLQQQTEKDDQTIDNIVLAHLYYEDLL